MRSGTEQCGSQIAVGRGGQGGGRRSGRQEEEEEDEEDEDEDARKRKAADIKSNNPHLAGGEKDLRGLVEILVKPSLVLVLVRAYCGKHGEGPLRGLSMILRSSHDLEQITLRRLLSATGPDEKTL